VVAYTDLKTGRTLHLIINQAIHVPHLDHHLLCSMQCCANEVIVDETPKFLAIKPTDQTHALTVPDPDDPLQTLTLPLTLRGVTSLLHVRNVTADDFYNEDIPRIDLTLKILTWDLSMTLYAEQENGMIDHSDAIVRDAAVRGPDLVINALHSLTTNFANITHDCNFIQVQLSHVNISSIDTSLNGHIRTHKTTSIDYTTLASRWMISLEKAKRTVQQMTQRGVWTCLNPMLARRFPTNDQMLHYKRLPHPVFTDTMFAWTASKQGSKCAQAYATLFGGHEHIL
jgi:hypothetical protein